MNGWLVPEYYLGCLLAFCVGNLVTAGLVGGQSSTRLHSETRKNDCKPNNTDLVICGGIEFSLDANNIVSVSSAPSRLLKKALA